jgi:hypothetical protein
MDFGHNPYGKVVFNINCSTFVAFFESNYMFALINIFFCKYNSSLYFQ